MDKPVSEFFTLFDWGVVVLYLLFTTWVGHALRGKQGTIKDFFLGGKTLPWTAVSGSIIATEISALTFIGVPGTFFAINGDFTYLQWGLGAIIARFMVAFWLVPKYFKEEIYSPYDYIGDRLGESVKRLVTFLFSLGAILGQSVRVLVTAIILKVVTGMEIHVCIIFIGIFAICWTLMGGMRTVIWTDVVQFFLFVGGATIALLWLIGGVDGGLKSIVSMNREAPFVEFEWNGKEEKRRVFKVGTEDDFERQIIIEKDKKTGEATVIGTVKGGGNIFVDGKEIDGYPYRENKMQLLEFGWLDPATKRALTYTFWIGLLAMPFQNFVALGSDQLMAQRMFCCRNRSDAQKALVVSSSSILITIIMMYVGAGLYAWYQQQVLTPSEAALFFDNSNHVFPTWIIKVLPAGVSGLIIAGAFAAAISSLDSILAALSQTTLSVFLGRKKFEESQGSKKMVMTSRVMVIVWGILLSGVSMALYEVYKQGDSDLIGFAFGVITYTYGPMLGTLLLAVLPVRANFIGILLGSIISILVVASMRNEFISIVEFFKGSEIELWSWLQSWRAMLNQIAFPWFYVINGAITFLLGWLLGRATSAPEKSA